MQALPCHAGQGTEEQAERAEADADREHHDHEFQHTHGRVPAILEAGGDQRPCDGRRRKPADDEGDEPDAILDGRPALGVELRQNASWVFDVREPCRTTRCTPPAQ